MDEMGLTANEIEIIEKALMYDFRLYIKDKDRQNFTKEELLEVIDSFTIARNSK